MNLGPIKLTKEAWDNLFHEIEPITRESDGKVLRRFRLLDPENGVIYVEDPMDYLFEMEGQTIEPMKMPNASILFDNTVKDLEENLE